MIKKDPEKDYNKVYQRLREFTQWELNRCVAWIHEFNPLIGASPIDLILAGRAVEVIRFIDETEQWEGLGSNAREALSGPR